MGGAHISADWLICLQALSYSTVGRASKHLANCIHSPADMVLVRREDVSPKECVGEEGEGRGREESGWRAVGELRG